MSGVLGVIVPWPDANAHMVSKMDCPRGVRHNDSIAFLCVLSLCVGVCVCVSTFIHSFIARVVVFFLPLPA